MLEVELMSLVVVTILAFITVAFGAIEFGTGGAASPGAIPAYAAAVVAVLTLFGFGWLFDSGNKLENDCVS